MALPFARFCQLIEVVGRAKTKDQKFTYSQSVFLAWWIYTTIERAENSKAITMPEMMHMYGVISDSEMEQAKLDRIEADKQEIIEAHKNAERAEKMFTGQT